MDLKSKRENKSKDEIKIDLQLRQAQMVKRCDDKYLRQRLKLEHEESLEEEKLLCAQSASDLRRRQIQQTYKLAKELSRRKRENIQQSVKLDSIKTNVQHPSHNALDEIRSHLLEETIIQEAKQAQLLNQWYQNNNFEKKRKIAIKEKKQNLRKDLQNQLTENQRKICNVAEEKHRERKVIEETNRLIPDENLKSEKQKKVTARYLQTEKQPLLRAREILKEKHEAVIKEEHEKVKEMIIKKQIKERQHVKEKTDIYVAKDATLEKISRKLLEDECKKRERDDICNELYWERKQNEYAEEYRKLRLKKHYIAKELLDDMVRHQKSIAEQKAKEDEIDNAFARYLAEEKKRIEENAKRKETEHHKKITQYQKEIQDTLTNNRIQHALEILKKQSELCE